MVTNGRLCPACGHSDHRGRLCGFYTEKTPSYPEGVRSFCSCLRDMENRKRLPQH